jgi:hypothetical protein
LLLHSLLRFVFLLVSPHEVRPDFVNQIPIVSVVRSLELPRLHVIDSLIEHCTLDCGCLHCEYQCRNNECQSRSWFRHIST